DQRISWRTAAFARRTLATQPDLLTLLDAGWNAHLELPAVGKNHTPRSALGCFLEGDGGCQLDILTAPGHVAAFAAATDTAQDVGEDVLGGKSRAIAAPFEACLSPALAPGPRAKAAEAVGAGVEALGLAVCVDLAAIELGALFLIPQNFVGRIHLLKAL